MSEVLVVIGAGGIGAAIARRLGPGRTVVIADFDQAALDRVGGELAGEGYEVRPHVVDVSRRESVAELAAAAADSGPITAVAHTAGLSPVQAQVPAILGVDLAGVAYFLDEFELVIAAGGAAVVIASMAGSLVAGHLPAEMETALASTPSDELLALPFLGGITEPAEAYAIAKRANQLRVRVACRSWGARGARVNSISPGVISTAMGRAELDGESGAVMREMIGSSGTGRIGTPADIAGAAAFLLGPEASYITGIDLLVDGGVVAATAGAAARRR